LGNLSIPESVQKLQTALQAKAKENSGFRFYALYDKIHREDVLRFAYLRCKSNGGAAGVDGHEFDDIESYGREQWLRELAQELREKKYQPQAVRRVFIPKRGGTGLRPLGIPTVSANYPGTQRVFGMDGSSTCIPPAERSAFPRP